MEAIPRLAGPLGIAQVPSRDQHCLVQTRKTQEASLAHQGHLKFLIPLGLALAIPERLGDVLPTA